jgi:CRP-like cAMP-binding protein
MYTTVEALPNHPRAVRLPVSLRVATQPVVKEMRLSRGHTLFYAEDKADSFFEIVSGVIRCCRLTHDGRRQVFRFAEAGELLGISAEDDYGYSAEALDDVVVRRRRMSELDEAMARDAVLRRRVLQSLRNEIVATRTQMMLLGRMNATERLTTFLHGLAAEASGDGCIELPMSRTDIADYLGLAIETVSRKFGELTALGIIQLETPQRVRITDPARMASMAEAA